MRCVFVILASLSLFAAGVYAGTEGFSAWIETAARDLGNYNGLWSMLQGVFTPIAIFTSVWFALSQEKDRNLSNLISLRNISHMSARMIIQYVDGPYTRNKSSRTSEVETVTRVWQSVNFSTIYPPFLTKSFVDIYHMHMRLVSKEADSQLDYDGDTVSRVKKSIERIDYYISNKSAVMLHGDFHMKSWCGRRLDDLKFWERDHTIGEYEDVPRN